MTVKLIFFTSAVMAFLGMFVCIGALAANNLANQWQEALTKTATIRISASAEQMDTQTNAVLSLLKKTPGVSNVKLIDHNEQRKILAPWFGEDIPVDILPLPQLISLQETADGYDSEGLRLRLAAEAPGATLDDHSRWQRPVITISKRLRLLGLLSISLIFAATFSFMTLATNSSLAANFPTLKTLHLIGAKDSYIVRAFARRFTVNAFMGAVLGSCVAFLLLSIALLSQENNHILGEYNLINGAWIFMLPIPLIIALIAFLATRRSTFRLLEEII